MGEETDDFAGGRPYSPLADGPETGFDPHYLATDCDAGHLPPARRYLATWADERGYTWHWPNRFQRTR